MAHGIGFLHEGTSALDKEIVEELFNAGAIQVVVVPRTMCYQVNMRYGETPISDLMSINSSECTPLSTGSLL